MKKLIFIPLVMILSANNFSCSKKTEKTIEVRDDQNLDVLNNRIIELEKKLASQQAPNRPLTVAPQFETQKGEISRLNDELTKLKIIVETERELSRVQLAENGKRHNQHVGSLQSEIKRLENLFQNKIRARSLPALNTRLLTAGQGLDGHASLQKFTGDYKVLVIPVEFTDVKFDDREFFVKGEATNSKAQNYLFGNATGTMTTYYKHASLGQFNLSGIVTDPITASGPLANYGGNNVDGDDQNPGGLVVEALQQIRDNNKSINWDEFDNWDVTDYDGDGNFHEPDGFIDSVILIYAGHQESSCGGLYDGIEPNDPRAEVAKKCLDLIWPHRTALRITDQNDPEYRKEGPIVEGIQRPSFAGIQITENLFASDYNMQSEYSDRSTFTHEFGHSLGLPDIYAYDGENNVSQWELMATNSNTNAQEFSTYSKLILGWLSPKVIKQGENTSAYLGSYNFVSHAMRKDRSNFEGPTTSEELVGERMQKVDILSRVPGFDEPVYRSIVVLPEATIETIKVADLPQSFGEFSAYSSRFDNDDRAITLNFDVPNEDKVEVSFDLIYSFESETNFNIEDHDNINVKVVENYDFGYAAINGKEIDFYTLLSGDENQDSLVEKNSDCHAEAVLEARKLLIEFPNLVTEQGRNDFNQKVAACRKPVARKVTYDLSKFKGQKIELKIGALTDSNVNEFGMFVDNIKLNDSLIEDFEDANENSTNDFVLTSNGEERTTSNQFYLMEYRTPGDSFNKQSLNMDNNIEINSWSMFVDSDLTPADSDEKLKSSERFRLVEQKAQPGVLVWYFNGKYNSSQNAASIQNGEGYLLVVNPRNEDLKMPGFYQDEKYLDANGLIDRKNEEFLDLIENQRHEYNCFAAKSYQEYITASELYCENFSDVEQVSQYKFKNKSLADYATLNATILPQNIKQIAISRPDPNSIETRTMYATFRPQEDKEFSASKVYKINKETNKLVLDEKLTASVPKYAPISMFDDQNIATSAHPRFEFESAKVIPKGLMFYIAKPAERILNQFKSENPDVDGSVQRAPKAKVVINWQ